MSVRSSKNDPVSETTNTNELLVDQPDFKHSVLMCRQLSYTVSVSVTTEVQTLRQSSDCSATDFSTRTLFFSVVTTQSRQLMFCVGVLELLALRRSDKRLFESVST